MSEVNISIEPATIAKLALQPGDTVVLMLSENFEELSDSVETAIRERTKIHFPNNQTIVLSPGMKIGVIEQGCDKPIFLRSPT